MPRLAPRILLGLAAAIFIAGAALHAAVFFMAARARIAAAGPLSPLMAGELKTLWLADSTTLAAVGLACAWLAARPAAADRSVVLLLALVPAGTTALLYAFLGGFYAAHLLAAATAMVVAAAMTTGPARAVSAGPAAAQ